MLTYSRISRASSANEQTHCEHVHVFVDKFILRLRLEFVTKWCNINVNTNIRIVSGCIIRLLNVMTYRYVH